MRIALLGAGSLGTVIGAFITKGGADITLFDVDRAHVAALNTVGAKITGAMEMIVPVRAQMLSDMAGRFDLVFYLAKAPNNESALVPLCTHLHENSIVCTLQNGLPEEAVAFFVGRERTVGGTVGWGASIVAPGVSQMTSDPEKMTYEIGEIFGPATERLQQVKQILDLAGKCYITENLAGARWTKLLINAAYSGMSAALGCSYGDIMDNDKARLCAAFIADELIKVALTLGVKMEEFQGTDPTMLEMKHGKQDFPAMTELHHRIWGPHRQVIASMLYDLRLGRKTEIGALNGEVCNRGRGVGVPTPFNDKVVELVREAEATQRVNTFDMLSRFDELVEQAP